MVHGTREGIKVALAPLVTDAPILLAAWLVLSRLEGRSWALGIVALAGAVMLTRYAFDCFTPPPPETVGSGRAPHSLGRGVVANFLNPHPYLFWLTVGMTALPLPADLPEASVNANAQVVLTKRYLQKGPDGEPMEGVDTVRFSPPQVELARTLGLLSRRVVWPLAAVLAFLVALVVGNTVRLSFARRRDEVEIMLVARASEAGLPPPTTLCEACTAAHLDLATDVVRERCRKACGLR